MMQPQHRRPWGARVIKFAIVGVAAAIIFAIVFGLVVQVVWNRVMPPVFGLGPITYPQAFGLLLLAKVFFGGIGMRGRGFGRHRMHHRIGPDGSGSGNVGDFRDFWETEGREAFRTYVERKRAHPVD
jgi:hypothetical protein